MLRRILLAIPFLVLLALEALFLSQVLQVLTARPPDAEPPVSNSPLCRQGDPMQGVYNPWRLKVVNRCITVRGTVTHVARMADGDFHLDLLLDLQYSGLVNERNKLKQNGALVTEVVPDDQLGIREPKVGDRVEVTGPYVLDKLHGWMEIHPVWDLKVLP